MINQLLLEEVSFSRRLAKKNKRTSQIDSKNQRTIINGINLHIHDGERVAILGPNGSGKTTLLRLISGILEPDEGRISTGLDISALLDTGYGMVDSLTARENCKSKLILMGEDKKQIPSLIDSIEAFAEIGEYFDQPMRHLSSGMFARIAFSIATVKTHSIVLIDEGFGLADEQFRRKAQAVLEDLYFKSSILVFASHNIDLLSKTCNRGIVLINGTVEFDGSIDDAIQFNNKL
jgi:ABC-2 type transport system ATP-binding protein